MDEQRRLQPSDNVRIPSNIMLKSAYGDFLRRESNYIHDTITEIYNYIYFQCKQSDWDNLEIEGKLGSFQFKGDFVYSLQYIKEPFKIPAFPRNAPGGHITNYDFMSGLDKNRFYSICYFMDKESERQGSDIIRLEPINIKEICYKSGARSRTHYRDGQQVKQEIINKENKMHINIRDNGNDFRITSCKENLISMISFDDIPTNYREKFRVSYKFRFFRLDLTIVSSRREQDSSNPSEITYEVEYEFDELVKFLKSDSCRNFDEFKMMFLRFIQNIFCIYISSTTEFFEMRLPKARDGLDSLFGDYIEKNIKL